MSSCKLDKESIRTGNNQVRDIQVLRHQRGGWVGSENGSFLMIYSTVNHQRSGWVGLKTQKRDDVILEWPLTCSSEIMFSS